MITMERVEKAAVDYVLSTGRKPRFVLLDDKSFEEFNSTLIPKQRIRLDNDLPAKEDKMIATRIRTSADFEVEILRVVSERPIFEVVG